MKKLSVTLFKLHWPFQFFSRNPSDGTRQDPHSKPFPINLKRTGPLAKGSTRVIHFPGDEGGFVESKMLNEVLSADNAHTS